MSDRAWAWNLSEYRGDRWCGRVFIHGGSKSTGYLFSVPKPCESWNCREHAEEKALETIAWFNHIGREAPALHFIRYPDQGRVHDRMRQRRRPSDDWVTVRRWDGHVYHLATRAALGRGEPSAWVEVSHRQALYLVVNVLAGPGVLKVWWSRRWRPPPATKGSGDSRIFGAATAGHRDRAVAIAIDHMCVKYGVRFGDGDPLPKAVPINEFFDAIEVALNAERPHGKPMDQRAEVSR